MSTIKSSAENLTLNADGANNDIKFQSNGVEKASIDQDGNVIAAGTISSTGDTTITNGDIVFATAGKGIVLGVTSNTDANTLDDYEEGTWTPAGTSTGGSWGNGDGRYVKIGSSVTCVGIITCTSSGTNNSLTGFPFANGTLLSVGSAYEAETTGHANLVRIDAGASQGAIRQHANGNSFTNTSIIKFSITYLTT